MRLSKRMLAALTAPAVALAGGTARADVFVNATVDKTKTVTVDVTVDIEKFVDLFVFEYISVDAVAEQIVVKNQRNQFNFVEDENADALATIDGSVATASGIVLINQAPGHVNNQGNEVSVTAANTPGNTGFRPVPGTTGIDGPVGFDDWTTTANVASFEPSISGVFAHAEVSVQQINGFVVGEDGGPVPVPEPPTEFANEYVNTFGATLTDSIIGSFGGGAGVAGVNQASGSLNNQNNALAIAIGDEAVYALGEADLGQFNTRNLVDTIDQLRTDEISGGSFDGFAGVAMVNQSSGSVNNQANVVDIAVTSSAQLPFAP